MILKVILGLLIAFLFIDLIYSISKYIINQQTEITVQPISEVEVEQINTSRKNLINNLCDTIGDAWEVPQDELQLTASLMPQSSTVMTVIYKINLIRFYIYWDKNRIDMSITRRNDETKVIGKKSIRFNKKNYLEKEFTFLEKYKPANEENAAQQIDINDIVNRLSDAIENEVKEQVHKEIQKYFEENKDHE